MIFEWNSLICNILSWLIFVKLCGHMFFLTVNKTKAGLFTDLAFVEPHLTVGEDADKDIDTSRYETVVSDAIVQAVDSVRRVWTKTKK